MGDSVGSNIFKRFEGNLQYTIVLQSVNDAHPTWNPQSFFLKLPVLVAQETFDG